MENVAQKNEKEISGAIKIDEREIRTHHNGLTRQDTRAESCKRKLLTKTDEVFLICERLPFETQIIKRYKLSAAFRMDNSAMMMVGARLRHISSTKWGTRQYMST